jgi:uridylate kinase
LSLDHLRNYAALLTLTLVVVASSFLILASEKERQVKLSIDKSAIQIVQGSARKLRGELGREIQVVEGSGRVLRGSLEQEILVVEGSGRVLRGDLGREIKVVESTGRVWKEPFAVDKSHIHVVEGSGRVMPNPSKA